MPTMVGSRSDGRIRPCAAAPDASSASETTTVPVTVTGPDGATAAGSPGDGTQPRTTSTPLPSASSTGVTTQQPDVPSYGRPETYTWSAVGADHQVRPGQVAQAEGLVRRDGRLRARRGDGVVQRRRYDELRGTGGVARLVVVEAGVGPDL